MRLRTAKRLRGALSSIELLLILGAVITFAIINLNGLFKQVTAQATSSKYLLEVSDLVARRITTITGTGVSRGLQVSLIVSNFGTNDVAVTSILVKCSGGEETIPISEIIGGGRLVIRPGESKTISFVTSVCVDAPRVYVEVQTPVGNVGAAAAVQ